MARQNSELLKSLVTVFGVIICGATITISLKYQDDYVIEKSVTQ